MTNAPAQPESLELAQLVARILDEKKGEEILILPVGDVVGITEYFVVATASNPSKRARSLRRSNREKSWILVDYGDVVVHIFVEESRRFYEIERLYKDIVPVSW